MVASGAQKRKLQAILTGRSQLVDFRQTIWLQKEGQ